MSAPAHGELGGLAHDALRACPGDDALGNGTIRLPSLNTRIKALAVFAHDEHVDTLAGARHRLGLDRTQVGEQIQ